jgi:hypothetical protein
MKMSCLLRLKCPYLPAKAGKPRTRTEEPILRAAGAIASRMLGETAIGNYKLVSVSDTSVKRNIEHWVDNAESQAIKRNYTQVITVLWEEKVWMFQTAFVCLHPCGMNPTVELMKILYYSIHF